MLLNPFPVAAGQLSAQQTQEAWKLRNPEGKWVRNDPQNTGLCELSMPHNDFTEAALKLDHVTKHNLFITPLSYVQ